MLKGIDVKERIEYVYSKDPDKANPTKFLLGNLTHADKINLFSDAIRQDKTLDIGKLQGKTIDIVRAGVKAIKNFDGKDFEPVPDEVIESIPFDVIGEIVAKVMEINFLREQEVKN